MKQTKKRLGLLFKLLRQNISAWQLCGFVVANLLGGIIVLIGIQACRDFNRFTDKEKGVLNEGYAVISKPISGLTTLTNLVGAQPTFSDREIKMLKEHPAVSGVGEFTAATFNIYGSFALGDIGVSTDLFMESVPDRFIDVKFEADTIWKAGINSREIPIIIPRRYLNVYNYGYASTKGLPQLSEGLTTMFPITLRIQGNGKMRYYSARIVGYTDRLNTILVPDGFLQQANGIYGEKEQKEPSRLILKTSSGAERNTLLEYLDKHNYIIEGDADNLRLQTLVHGILWVVIGIGATVSLLAFFLLLISIQLLIEKNKEKFTNLYSLGYSTRLIATPYILLVTGIDTLVWLAAILSVSLIYPHISGVLATLSPDIELAGILPLWGMAAAFIAAFTLLHSRIIVGQLRKICR